MGTSFPQKFCPRNINDLCHIVLCFIDTHFLMQPSQVADYMNLPFLANTRILISFLAPKSNSVYTGHASCSQFFIKTATTQQCPGHGPRAAFGCGHPERADSTLNGKAVTGKLNISEPVHQKRILRKRSNRRKHKSETPTAPVWQKKRNQHRPHPTKPTTNRPTTIMSPPV